MIPCVPQFDPSSQRLCDAVPGAMCRLAAGAPLGVGAPVVARHLRDCETCREFVEELGRVRRWLGAVEPPHELAQNLDELGIMAREALARELLARLARDLLARARGKRGRPLEESQRDGHRLSVLTDGLSNVPGMSAREVAAVELALHDEPVEPEVALEGAVCLDPLGLDIALAWLGFLERAGRGPLAHRLTDSLLARFV